MLTLSILQHGPHGICDMMMRAFCTYFSRCCLTQAFCHCCRVLLHTGLWTDEWQNAVHHVHQTSSSHCIAENQQKSRIWSDDQANNKLSFSPWIVLRGAWRCSSRPPWCKERRRFSDQIDTLIHPQIESRSQLITGICPRIWHGKKVMTAALGLSAMCCVRLRTICMTQISVSASMNLQFRFGASMVCGRNGSVCSLRVNLCMRYMWATAFIYFDENIMWRQAGFEQMLVSPAKRDQNEMGGLQKRDRFWCLSYLWTCCY